MLLLYQRFVLRDNTLLVKDNRCNGDDGSGSGSGGDGGDGGGGGGGGGDDGDGSDGGSDDGEYTSLTIAQPSPSHLYGSRKRTAGREV